MKNKLTFISLILLFLPLLGYSQFYTGGSEPAKSRWSSIETDNYNIIYLRGLDSLARVYAGILENSAAAVGASAGFTPNASYTRKMPVILRSNTVIANGLVSWTPRRMELNTIGDAYYPEAYPWEESVGIHESRHSSQMQFAGTKPFRWGRWLSGELLAGGLAAAYPGPAFMEGDAVVAETALSKAGRGRSADFLEYYRASFAEGEFRNFWRWRYGSQKLYTPDYYRAGYIAMAGLRTLYDVPDFTARYYERIADKGGVAFFNFQKTIKEQTGQNFRDAWTQISKELQSQWAADEQNRAPFITSEQQTRYGSQYQEYKAIRAYKGSIYAVKEGMALSPRLVRIDSAGKESTLMQWSAEASEPKLSPADGSLYWSSYRPHPRWSNQSYSEIYKRDSNGKTRQLTRGQRYFNPSISQDGSMLAVTEYPVDGSSAIVILNPEDGEPQHTYRAPDGLRIVESTWVADKLYISGITSEGFGIWELDGFRCILEPQAVNIKQLWEHEGKIMFSCDRTTVNELYALSTDGELLQLTSTRLGASDFRFSEDGNRLYYTMQGVDGRMIYSTETEGLISRAADYRQLPHYPMADELSAQEKTSIDYTPDVHTSEVKDYSRLAHLLRIHSWVPVYVDIDNVSSLSMSDLTSSAAPGATMFFQNDLGDSYGSIGYKAVDSRFKWRNSLHINYTYEGLLPVLEFNLDVNDRYSQLMTVGKDQQTGKRKLQGKYSDSPLVSTGLTAYVPLNFYSNGWTRGIIPQIRYSISNDNLDGAYADRLTASLRGYIMQSTSKAKLYPDFGIGTEIGYSVRPQLSNYFTHNIFANIYGYLPGLLKTHGTRLSLLYEHRGGKGIFAEAYANTAPRGYEGEVSQIIATYPESLKLSIDYAMPIFPVDWAGLSPLFYLKNFELTPHADISCYGFWKKMNIISSVGADLTARLGNFLWIPYDTRIGVSFNYISKNDITLVPQDVCNFSMIFSIDF